MHCDLKVNAVKEKYYTEVESPVLNSDNFIFFLSWLMLLCYIYTFLPSQALRNSEEDALFFFFF